MVFSDLSLYQIRYSSKGCIDQHGDIFDAATYSRFKHGCSESTRHYAESLASAIAQNYPHWGSHDVVIAGSAYKVAPTASQAIAELVFEYLQPFFPSLTKVKIHRESVFPSDYGLLSLEERQHLMNCNQISVDVPAIQNKKLIVIDDLRVTGAHETRIRELISEIDGEAVFAYVARLSGDFAPTLEAEVNYASITSVWDLLPIAKSHGFRPNVRVCKFLLSYKDSQEYRTFLSCVPAAVLSILHNFVCGDGYHAMIPYARNYQLLKAQLLKISDPISVAS